MTAYNETTARSVGQPMTVTLPGGYTITFTVRTTTPAGRTPRAVAAVPIPAFAGVAVGSLAYLSTPGKPALYQVVGAGAQTTVDNGGTTISLTNIVVKDSTNTAVAGYGFAMADAEITLNTEGLSWTSDQSLTLLTNQVGTSTGTANCLPNLAGQGSTSVSCVTPSTATATGSGNNDVILQAISPSFVTETMTETFSGQIDAAAFAILTSKITLNKTVVGRIHAADSFDLAITSPASSVLGTGTTGTTNSATTGAVTVLPLVSGSTAYTLSEAPTTGTPALLSDYARSWSCTNAATGSTTVLPNGATATSVTVSPQPGDDITCTVTNTARAPTLVLNKALGAARFTATDQFTTSIRAGAFGGAVQNSTANSTTTGTGSTVGAGTTGVTTLAGGSTYVLREDGAGTPAASLGNYTSTITCTDANNLQAGLPNNQPYNSATGLSVTPVFGAAISCTIANTPRPSIALTKALTNNRFATADQFTVAIRTGSASGTVVNSTTSSTTTGLGATVTPGTGTTGKYAATAGTTYYLTEALTSSTPPSKYTATISCADVNGLQTGLPSGAFSGSATITPVSGAAISCTLTNASIGVSALFKNATNLANGSTSDSRTSTTGTAVPGDTIQWVLNYANNTGANATVDITDLITNGQIYVPGSLRVPPSLSMQYTSNGGGTWTTGTPPAGANGVGALTTGSNRVAGVNSGTSALAPPFVANTLSFNTPGGDGYSVEGFGNSIYTVFHHSSGATVVFCATLANAVCPGWPAFSTYVSPVAGTPLGTGAIGSYTTAGVNGSFIYNGLLYWPVESTAAVGGNYPVGLQCLNLTTLKSCGFTQLDTVAIAPIGSVWAGIASDGIAASNGRHYYVDLNGNLLCFDPATAASCGITNAGIGAVVAANWGGHFAEVGTFGSYVAFTYLTGGNSYLFAYNVATPTPALVIAQFVGAPQPQNGPSEVFPVLSATGAVLGACSIYNSACFSIANLAIPDPWPATQFAFTPGTFGFGTGVAIGSKYYTTYGSSATLCYDFALRAGTGLVPECDTSGPGIVSPTRGPGDSQSYTVRPLANLPGCMADNGNASQIVVFNAATGGACVSASTSITKTTPTNYYCDGGTHVSNWDKLTLVGLTGSEYAQATVTLYDANGNPVPGFINVVMSGTSLDISSLVASGNYASLAASVTLTGVTNTAAVNAASAALSWTGDPMQMCYQTMVPPVSCLTTAPMSDVANVVTTAGSLTDGPGGTSSGSTSFAAAPTAAQCRLNFAKTSSAPVIQPGGGLTYTITVTNNGTMPYSASTPASFTDDLTNVLSGAAYSDNLSASAGTAAYTAPVLSWSGPLAAGASATIKYTVTASANPPATMTNTVVSPNPSNCTSSSPAAECTVIVPPVLQVGIQKSTPATTLTSNGQIVYTIVASNTGSVSAAGTVVSDPVPLGIASQTWTCSAAGGAVCPNASGTGGLNETLATFPAGSTVTYTVTATVVATPPAQVTNTATATPPSGGLCTPGNTPPPCHSVVTVPPVPQVGIQKSTPATTLTPNGQIVYTIVASNTGSVSAAGTVVSDPVPLGIASQTWTCAAAGGAACPNASGTGGLNETLAAFPAGSTVTYTVTATVVATPPAQVTNTATATPPSGGLCTPGNTPPPCHSVVTVPPVPQVGIQKSTPATTLTPNGQIVYTIVASNTGSVSAAGTVVSDPVPLGIASQTWTCSAAGGAVCPNASGTGGLNETLAAFPAGSTVTYTVTATVVATPPAQVTNTATATPPSGGLCTPGNTPPPCHSVVTVPPVPQVGIQKSTPATTLTPNGQIVYTIVASNTGSVSAAGTVVSDPVPLGIASQTWTCSAAGGTACPNASGTGGLNETLATFPAGSTVTYTVTATVVATPPAQVTNTAMATPPSGGLCVPSNTPPPCHSAATVPPVPQIGITKTANVSTLAPGGTVVYTVAVSNTGTVDAAGTVVADPIPAGIASQVWTCSAAGGAACPNASGSGALNETLGTFPVGGTVTYTVTALAAATPPAQVTNTATAMPPAGGVCAPGNTAPPCASTVTVTVNVIPPVKTPVDARWMLLAMAMLLVLQGGRRLWQRS